MALNKFMHPRNPFFNNPPDFAELAKLYPEFDKYCKYSGGKKKASIDFEDPSSLRALCCVLLKHLYGLEIELLLNHLIPRVPQRLNYVLWIEDLLKRKDTAIGIDIGCGASCIFGLLACSQNKQWKVLASEISEENVECASKNVTMNNLTEKISIQKVDEKTLLKQLLQLVDDGKIPKINKETQFDFIMCNPPFFSNEQEASGNSDEIRKPDKRHMAKSVNTSQSHESICDGGEVEFVKQIVDESILIDKRVKVYTVMLGKKKSLDILKEYLINQKQIENISEAQFCQGHTMRWGLAWSFWNEEKLIQFEYMNIGNKKQSILNSKNKLIKYDLPKNIIKEENYSIKLLLERFIKIFVENLKFEVTGQIPKTNSVELSIYDNTWSKQRAKRRKLNQPTTKEATVDDIRNSNKRSKPILNFFFRLNSNRINSNEIISILLSPIDSTSNQSQAYESLHQILQYLKNNLEILNS